MTRALVFNGTQPGEPMPFGAEALTGQGFELVRPLRAPVPGKVAAVVRDRKALHIEQPGLLAARHADLVLGYFEPNLHYPALLARLPLSPMGRAPLVSLVCWAAEDLLRGQRYQRERVLKILRSSSVISYLSANQGAIFVDHGVPPDRLLPLSFGIDLGRFADREHHGRDIDLLTVGQDAGRDADTLAAAISGTGIHLTVVAPPERVGQLARASETSLLGRVTFEEYLALLRRSRTVVVATHELAYPTGQTVALEAAATGCAVIVTATAAMSDYFTDGVTALMPPPGDARALRSAIRSVHEDEVMRTRIAQAGREHVRRHHGAALMWEQLADGLRERRVVAPWS